VRVVAPAPVYMVLWQVHEVVDSSITRDLRDSERSHLIMVAESVASC